MGWIIKDHIIVFDVEEVEKKILMVYNFSVKIGLSNIIMNGFDLKYLKYGFPLKEWGVCNLLNNLWSFVHNGQCENKFCKSECYLYIGKF